MITPSRIPANFAELYQACFGEEVDLSGVTTDARMIKNEVAWLVYEPMNRMCYIHFAAVIPAARNAQQAAMGFRQAIEWLRPQFDEIKMSTRRDNVIPQILALKNNFIIDGMRVGKSGKLQILWRTK